MISLLQKHLIMDGMRTKQKKKTRRKDKTTGFNFRVGISYLKCSKLFKHYHYAFKVINKLVWK